MSKINNEEALGFGALILGIGMFFGVMMSNYNYTALKECMILEIQGFQSDMEWDIRQGVVDSAYAEYYLHYWRYLEEQLTETPEEYISWYE